MVVTAASARDAALVLMDCPLAAPTRFTMKPPLLVRTRRNLVALFEPRTLIHVNGTRWTIQAPPLTPNGVLAITVRAACEFIGIEPTRFAIAQRLLDAYPEQEPWLLPVARAIIRTDRVRAAQPLLATMIVAHAASVAHLLKHG